MAIALLNQSPCNADDFAATRATEKSMLEEVVSPTSGSATFSINHCPLNFEREPGIDYEVLEKDLKLALKIGNERRNIEQQRLFFFPETYRGLFDRVRKSLGVPGLTISDSSGQPGIYFMPSSESSSIFSRIKDLTEGLAVLYVEEGRHHDAEQLVGGMIKASYEANQELYAAKLELVLGDICRQSGQASDAMLKYQDALEKIKLIQPTDANLVAETYLRIAYCDYDLFAWTEAQRYVQKAKVITSQTGPTTADCPGEDGPHTLTVSSIATLKTLASDVIQDKKLGSAETAAEIQSMKALILSQLPSNVGGEALRKYLNSQQRQAQTRREIEWRRRSNEQITFWQDEYTKRLRRAIDEIKQLAQQNSADMHEHQERQMRQQAVSSVSAENASIRAMEQSETSRNASMSASRQGTSYMSRYVSH
jgi:tetratricopeptide (TPR) repeat protein